MTVTDISGQPIGLICKAQALQDDCLAPVNGKARSSETPLRNYQSTLRKIPEE